MGLDEYKLKTSITEEVEERVTAESRFKKEKDGAHSLGACLGKDYDAYVCRVKTVDRSTSGHAWLE